MGRSVTPIDVGTPYAQFGARLRSAREAAGLSMTELGTKVPCALSTISEAEAGKKLPSLGLTLEMLRTCNALIGRSRYAPPGRPREVWIARWVEADDRARGVMPRRTHTYRGEPRLSTSHYGLLRDVHTTAELRRQLDLLRISVGYPTVESLCRIPVPECCERRLKRSMVAATFSTRIETLPSFHAIYHLVGACRLWEARETGTKPRPDLISKEMGKWGDLWRALNGRSRSRLSPSPAKPQLGSTRPFAPLPEDLTPGARALAQSLRSLVEISGVADTEFAAYCEISFNTFSRCLRGRRIISDEALRASIRLAGRGRDEHWHAETLGRLLNERRKAVGESGKTREYELAVLRERLAAMESELARHRTAEQP